MPSREEESLQAQNQLAQAQNSVTTFDRAVMQAQSHPAEQTIEQAENALVHAEHALSNVNPDDAAQADALQLARQQLDASKQRLEQAKRQEQK